VAVVIEETASLISPGLNQADNLSRDCPAPTGIGVARLQPGLALPGSNRDWRFGRAATGQALDQP